MSLSFHLSLICLMLIICCMIFSCLSPSVGYLMKSTEPAKLLSQPCRSSSGRQQKFTHIFRLANRIWTCKSLRRSLSITFEIKLCDFVSQLLLLALRAIGAEADMRSFIWCDIPLQQIIIRVRDDTFWVLQQGARYWRRRWLLLWFFHIFFLIIILHIFRDLLVLVLVITFYILLAKALSRSTPSLEPLLLIRPITIVWPYERWQIFGRPVPELIVIDQHSV